MAKRRKVEYYEDNVECFYCGKPVYDNSWRCPNCGKWFREGRISVLGIIAIIAIVIALALYIVQPSFSFGEENGETEKRYGVLLNIDPGPDTLRAVPGGYAEWGVQMTSLSNVADNFEFSSVDASPLQITYDTQTVGLTSGQRFINIIRIDVPSIAEVRSYNFKVFATSKSDSTANDFLNLTVDVVSLNTRTVVLSDKVQCNYVLWVKEVGNVHDDSYTRGSPLFVAIDSANADDTYISVLDGFAGGMIGMRTGETKTVILPPGQGYVNPNDPKTGDLVDKTLIFQITLVSIDTP
ncbi:MAG: FKBP-type peptidyl-prolyl cis-trans isomerase [Thermoplasmata archaeon]